MSGLYGRTWVSQFGASLRQPTGELTHAGQAWADAIAGLTPRHIAAGVAAANLSGKEFPPNAPRFRVMALGLPNLSDVEAELLPGRDRSPFAMLVWSKLDAYGYRSADGFDQRRMLSAAYDAAMRSVQAGTPLPAPAKALGYEPVRAPEVQDRDRARAAMERAASELAAAFATASPTISELGDSLASTSAALQQAGREAIESAGAALSRSAASAPEDEA